MTHKQMIAKLDTTDEEFNSYLTKSSKFINTLTPGELALHKRIHPPSLPAPFLNQKVKSEDITDLYKSAPNLVGSFTAAIENNPGGH